MFNSNILIQSKLKELLKDIYLLGEESESIQTEDFIKLIESKLLSLLRIEKDSYY